MSYQVLARKWRPQRFDDVVGQGSVTRTLKNAIASGRIAHAFVFAGPRGVGKTTTARILARALNCQNGATADPCGTCEACVEIAAGRDMDVLEIDAATHTQVEKVRDVIISGLSIPPVRDRYKIFIIDEVHQLSGHSFNALLKSIEEPPPYVVFMMATTELQKIPDTITSRSQVHEFRTIAERAIVAHLRKIAAAEQLDVSDEAFTLLARVADGSMRDGLTALDQVLAFAGTKVTGPDVSDVLGLVGRDLLLEIMAAVADEEAQAAFALAGRAIESGYDLRLLCRELSRLVRDLMLVTVDAGRLDDPEVAPAGERERIAALARRFSREDLLRAFDLIARAEIDLRNAAEPRYHLEMALLKWIHLRKLLPLADVIEQLTKGGTLPPRPGPPGPSGGAAGSGPAPSSSARRPMPGRGDVPPASPRPPGVRPVAGQPVSPAATRPLPPPPARGDVEPDSVFEAEPEEGVIEDPTTGARPSRPNPLAPAAAPGLVARAAGPLPAAAAPVAPAAPANVAREAGPAVPSTVALKEAFLAEVQRAKVGFFRMTVEQAHRVEVAGDRIVFFFSPAQRLLKDQVELNRTWLEPLAARLAGRRMAVAGVLAEPQMEKSAPAGDGGGDRSTLPARPSDELKAEVAADPNMKTLFELIPLEITDVERL